MQAKEVIDTLQPTYILGQIGASLRNSFNLPGFSLDFLPTLLFLLILLGIALLIFRLYLRARKISREREKTNQGIYTPNCITPSGTRKRR